MALGARRVGRVSKTPPEPDACVSAEGEAGKGGHGVPDPVFAFRLTRRAPDKALMIRSKLPKKIPRGDRGILSGARLLFRAVQESNEVVPAGRFIEGKINILALEDALQALLRYAAFHRRQID